MPCRGGVVRGTGAGDVEGKGGEPAQQQEPEGWVREEGGGEGRGGVWRVWPG